MSRLTWEDRDYQDGVDRAAVYIHGGNVNVWNGLITVTEKPSDIRQKIRYVDGVRTLNYRAEDSYASSVECFTYPDVMLGARTVFDLTYRIKTLKGYQIHLVYNAIARSPGKGYRKENDPGTFTLDISTKPRAMPLLRSPSAHIVIDTAQAYPPVVDLFEDLIYGNDDDSPRFPDPDELIPLFDVNALFQVVDNGDGTATISAPDEVFDWLSDTQAIANWPYVNPVDANTVRIRNF